MKREPKSKVVKLQDPIYEGDEEITTFTIYEPTAAQIRKWGIPADIKEGSVSNEAIFNYVFRGVTPPSLIAQISGRDYFTLIGEMMNFFASSDDSDDKN